MKKSKKEMRNKERVEQRTVIDFRLKKGNRSGVNGKQGLSSCREQRWIGWGGRV